jgi:3-oxoacyl-[acyl-carrier-protein] synthase II
VDSPASVKLIGKVQAKTTEGKLSYFARHALKEAFEDSGLKEEQLEKTKVSIVLGNGIGEAQAYYEQFQENKDMDEDELQKILPGKVTSMLAEEFGVNARSTTIVGACSSSIYSIGKAFRAIKEGKTDISYVVGVEAAVSPLGVSAFQILGILSPSSDKDCGSMPFDVRRNGFVLGEGSGAVVLEEYEHAKKRNAKIYCEVVGFGASCDAQKITAPDTEGIGAEIAVRDALKEADLPDNQIDYFNAHGTGTRINDEVEAKVLLHVFGEKQPYVSATKSMTGHLIGACGLVESIICSYALYEQFVPGTANLDTPDNNYPLNYVYEGKPAHLETAMNNTCAFGGQNATLILKRVVEPEPEKGAK